MKVIFCYLQFTELLESVNKVKLSKHQVFSLYRCYSKLFAGEEKEFGIDIAGDRAKPCVSSRAEPSCVDVESYRAKPSGVADEVVSRVVTGRPCPGNRINLLQPCARDRPRLIDPDSTKHQASEIGPSRESS